jgi:hypothetical protein
MVLPHMVSNRQTKNAPRCSEDVYMNGSMDMNGTRSTHGTKADLAKIVL